MKTPELVTCPPSLAGPPEDAWAKPRAQPGGSSNNPGMPPSIRGPDLSSHRRTPRLKDERDFLGPPSYCLDPFLSSSKGEAGLSALEQRGCGGLTDWAGSYLGAWLALGA